MQSLILALVLAGTLAEPATAASTPRCIAIVGPLRTAHHTEHMALLYVSMFLRGATHEFYLRLRK